MMKKGFTTKRESQKKDSDFSFANERREQTRYSAFTLIETMVAISILMLSISGPLYTASRAVVAANNSRDQFTARYLAQEGIEYIRMMRDNEYLKRFIANDPSASADAWNDFLSGADASSITNCRVSACTFDPMLALGYGSSLGPATGNPPLYMSRAADGVTHYYTQQISGNTLTIFTRTVQVKDIPGTAALYHEKTVVSTVSWSSHNVPYSETVTNHITSWQ